MEAGDTTEGVLKLPGTELEKRSRWLFWVGMGVFVIATALAGLWVLSHDTVAKVHTLQVQLAAAQPWLLAWRCGLLGFLVGCYPFWVNKAADVLHVHPTLRQVVLNQRWQVASLLLLVEVLFAQGGLALLLHGLFPDR